MFIPECKKKSIDYFDQFLNENIQFKWQFKEQIGNHD